MNVSTCKRALGIVLVGSAVVAVPAISSGWGIVTKGSVCVPAAPDDVDNLYYTRFGVHNAGADGASVICPLQVSFPQMNSAELFVYDRHPSQNVCCTMRLTEGSGAVFLTQSRCTSGSSSGALTLNYSWPSLGWAAPIFECDLPPVSNGAFSHVTTIGGGGLDPQ